MPVVRLSLEARPAAPCQFFQDYRAQPIATAACPSSSGKGVGACPAAAAARPTRATPGKQKREGKSFRTPLKIYDPAPPQTAGHLPKPPHRASTSDFATI